MSRRMVKALCDLRDGVGKRAALLRPAPAVPDLEVVHVPRDNDVAVDPGVVEQRLVEGHPARGVERRVERARREVAGELRAPGAERIQALEEALRPALE